jgi:DNA polymerase-3 subunit beta
MKALCNRESLLAAFQLASAAIPTRDVKPILKNLKAIAEDDRCTLMATDLELGIRLELRGLKVEQGGEAILPASRLLAILRESQDEELTIEADSNSCKVLGASLEFDMPSEDPGSFPDLPTFNEDKYHEITAGSLREMIRRTGFAAAQESARYSMTGVLWELEDSNVRLVATDGRRLAMMTGSGTAQGGHSTKGQTPVVPTKAMALLERNLADDSEVVRVSLRANEALFKTDRAMISSRLVEGRYPDYRQVFPKKQTTKIPIQAGSLLAAVKQAAIMTDDETRRVDFSFAKKKLTLQAKGATTGRSKVDMPLDYDGKPLVIGFNPAFLIDMLRVLPSEMELSLELVDPSTPVLLKAGSDYSYLVMPLT